MITQFLLRWREARRQKYIRKILIKRARLMGELDGFDLGGLTAPLRRGQIAQCNEILRQFGHKDES